MKKETKIISKNYGSIPHVIGSRLGKKDFELNQGQSDILTKKARDWKDLIIVQEKLDGSNVGVYKDGNGDIHAITRSGYLAETSPYKQHHLFSLWVDEYKYAFEFLLHRGDRIVGEWMLQAHGTKYKIIDRDLLFRPLDYISNKTRMSFIEFKEILNSISPMLKMPKLLHIGQPISIKNTKNKIAQLEKDEERIDKIEGAVYRCEREGKVDFIAKYVRNEKEDGIYLPAKTGKDEVWNYEESN